MTGIDVNVLVKEILDVYVEKIPEGSLTMSELVSQSKAQDPKVSESRVRKIVGEKLASGEWDKTRIGNCFYYWKKEV
jgi:hypothetical protein